MMYNKPTTADYFLRGTPYSTFTGALTGENIYLVKTKLTISISWSEIVGATVDDQRMQLDKHLMEEITDTN
jgi:hypothetical protein